MLLISLEKKYMRARITVLISDNNRKYTVDDIRNTRRPEAYEVISITDDEDIIAVLSDNRTPDVIITVGESENYKKLCTMPLYIRKVWVHFDSSMDVDIERCVSANLKRTVVEDLMKGVFSIFTPTYNTSLEKLEKLYKSLISQTYSEWNWWILDDSTDNRVEEYILSLKDPRICLFKNVTNHGNIGFNKHSIAMLCDGEFLVEIDHDDSITPNCLERLRKAFEKYDCDFCYSYTIELIDNTPITYGNYFSLGLGRYEEAWYNGKVYPIPTSPNINALSLRHIVALPNHVRCWKKDFYHKICGHNRNLAVLDDMEILIRTALNGKMCKIPEFLYIQDEGTSINSERGDTTQAKKAECIRELGDILREVYDKKIHDYFTEIGVPDPYWDEETQRARIYDGPHKDAKDINTVLEG